ncbi:putative Scaffold attachment factor B2 [Corchorus olitorius]|uniref:Scaffold attachment factor B2 n=1 Tax=Corchorus olitorius TaxID=93759 RepID=A0A1R3HFZ8_9ROSI|nr:putative Scaffold attachment factor B2 [Corchorus olitorius]
MEDIVVSLKIKLQRAEDSSEARRLEEECRKLQLEKEKTKREKAELLAETPETV